jgi:hypothetical protein
MMLVLVVVACRGGGRLVELGVVLVAASADALSQR